MNGKTGTGNGGTFHYYNHSWQTKANANLVKKIFDCKPARVPSDRVEEIVWQETKKFLTEAKMARELLDEAKLAWAKAKAENPVERLKKKISSTNGQIAALAERIGLLPKEIDAGALVTQLAKLQAAKVDLEAQIESSNGPQVAAEEPLSPKDFGVFRRQLKALLDQASDPNTKACLISKIVQKVLISENGIEIFFYAGKSHYQRELGDENSPGRILDPSGSNNPTKNKTPAANAAGADILFQLQSRSVVGLPTLTLGAGDGT